MKENSVLYKDYPENNEIGIPAKWIFVAEDLLSEDQYRRWLFYTFRYMGFCGIGYTGDAVIDMLLNAVYDEDEYFFEKYWQSILKNRQKNTPLQDKLKVSRAWSKEEQLDDYFNR